MRSYCAIAVLTVCSAPRLSAQSPAPVSTTPKLTGYVQARFQSIGDSAVFFLRRVRFGAQGNLTPWASYKVQDRKSTRLNSSHGYISYAVFCLKKKNNNIA